MCYLCQVFMTHCVTKATPNNVLTTSSAITGKHTHMSIKFCGLIFHVFDWQEKSWGINLCGHGGVEGTIISMLVIIDYCS